MPHTAPGSLGSLSFLAWTALKSQAKTVFPSISGAAHRLFRDSGFDFSMKQENLPQECCSTSPKISKGLMALQSIASRGGDTQDSEKKPQSTQQSLNKSTQAAAGCFYGKEVQGLGGVLLTWLRPLFSLKGHGSRQPAELGGGLVASCHTEPRGPEDCSLW